jgi:lipopolysaccharide export system ATP-binding protein
MSRIEAGVSDLFGLFRRKGGPPRRDAPADPRRSIARPVAGPMFTGAEEAMNLPRSQKPPPKREPARIAAPNAAPPRKDQAAAPPRGDQAGAPPRREQAGAPPRPDQRQAPPRLDQPRREVSRDQNRGEPVYNDHARPDPVARPQREPPRQELPRQEALRREPPRREPERRPEPPRRAPERRQDARRSDDSWRNSAAAQGFLAAHGVERSFVGRKVVKGVSLYVRRGEAVGLLGPNGAGKTTVFYMITGLITADAGRIELDGHDVTALPMYQRARLGIGYLPQEASIFRGLNVEENIRAVLEVVEPSRKRRERDLDALLEEFNITRLRKSPSIALSGGERRRVEIARALATRPNYMLLDEPFAGIDPIAVGDIQALVRHLTQRGIGVLITDHNVRETLGLTDRAYIIYSGEVLMEGQAEDIVNNPDVRRLYLGEEFRM